MVAYGKEVGIEMVNTSRLSRGLVDQPYSDIDLRNTTRGVLLEHGKAPLNNDPPKRPSYFARIATESGEKTVWGAGLKDAIRDAGVQVGQGIAVTNAGKQVGDYTRKGQTVAFTRTQWEVRAIDPGHPLERAPAGESLSRTAQQIAAYVNEYRAVSEMADRFGYSALAHAMAAAAQSLERLEPLETKGNDAVPNDAQIRVDQTQFEERLAAMQKSLEELDHRIRQAPPELRPELDQRFNVILKDAQELRPLGEETQSLSEPAADSIYSPRTASELAQSIKDGPAERLANALKDTGLDANEIAARIDLTAKNAALEMQWVERDMRAVAHAHGFDMSTEAGLARTQEKTGEIYDRIEHTLGLRQELVQGSGQELDRNDLISRHGIANVEKAESAFEEYEAADKNLELALLGRAEPQELPEGGYGYVSRSQAEIDRDNQALTRAERRLEQATDRIVSLVTEGNGAAREMAMSDQALRYEFARRNVELSQTDDRTKALDDAKALVAQGSLSSDEARRLRENVEKALGPEAVTAMQRGEGVQIPGLDEAKSRDFAVAYLKADEQWGRNHSDALSQHNAAAAQLEQEQRRQREARGQELRGHDFD